MSIYARKYKPSKWEPIIFADKLDDMFTDFAARDFGIKDMRMMVRRKNMAKPLDKDDFSFYFAILQEHKRNVRSHIKLLTSAVRLANVYPSTESDFKERMEHQNQAIFACILLSKEIKEIVRRFDVDLNKFDIYQEGIDRYDRTI